jgi:hypothetical protein
MRRNLIALEIELTIPAIAKMEAVVKAEKDGESQSRPTNKINRKSISLSCWKCEDEWEES